MTYPPSPTRLDYVSTPWVDPQGNEWLWDDAKLTWNPVLPVTEGVSEATPSTLAMRDSGGGFANVFLSIKDSVTGFFGKLLATNKLSADREYQTPNASGTLALTSRTDGKVAQADAHDMTTTSSPTFASVTSTYFYAPIVANTSVGSRAYLLYDERGWFRKGINSCGPGDDVGAADVSLSRISAGKWAIGNGTPGDYSGSLKLANLEATGTIKTVSYTNAAAVASSSATAVAAGDGAQAYISDLDKPVWSDGTVWKFADGTTLT